MKRKNQNDIIEFKKGDQIIIIKKGDKSKNKKWDLIKLFCTAKEAVNKI